jgi:hypothetical protein
MRIHSGAALLSAWLALVLLPGAAFAAEGVFYAGAAGTGSERIFERGGLKLVARCNQGPELQLTARTREEHAAIHVNSQPGVNPAPTGYAEHDDLSSAVGLQLFGPVGALDIVNSTIRTGELIYARRDGATVTISYLAAQDFGFPDCGFFGTAVVAGGQPEVVDYRARSRSDPRTFFDRGGLKLRGSCGEFGALDVVARSRHQNASIHVGSIGSAANDHFAEQDDLDPGVPFDLFSALGTVPDSQSGQIVYSRPGGPNLAIEWLSAEGIFGQESKCAFIGASAIAGRDSPDRADFRSDVGQLSTVFFDRAGLDLGATCNSGPAFGGTFHSSDSDALIQGYNEQYDPADATTSSGGSGDETTLTPGSTPSSFDNAIGQLIVARESNHSVQTLSWMAELGEGLGATKDCAFVGVARLAKP